MPFVTQSKYTSKDYNPKEVQKVNAIRKNEYEKKISNKMEKEIKQCTFKPAINKNKLIESYLEHS